MPIDIILRLDPHCRKKERLTLAFDPRSRMADLNDPCNIVSPSRFHHSDRHQQNHQQRRLFTLSVLFFCINAATTCLACFHCGLDYLPIDWQTKERHQPQSDSATDSSLLTLFWWWWIWPGLPRSQHISFVYCVCAKFVLQTPSHYVDNSFVTKVSCSFSVCFHNQLIARQRARFCPTGLTPAFPAPIFRIRTTVISSTKFGLWKISSVDFRLHHLSSHQHRLHHLHHNCKNAQ